MPRLDSRIRNTAERTYRGEEEARFLLSQLNEGRIINRDSLRQIILALQELGDCRPMTRRILSGDPAQIEEIRKVEAVNKVPPAICGATPSAPAVAPRRWYSPRMAVRRERCGT